MADDLNAGQTPEDLRRVVARRVVDDDDLFTSFSKVDGHNASDHGFNRVRFIKCRNDDR